MLVYAMFVHEDILFRLFCPHNTPHFHQIPLLFLDFSFSLFWTCDLSYVSFYASFYATVTNSLLMAHCAVGQIFHQLFVLAYLKDPEQVVHSSDS